MQETWVRSLDQKYPLEKYSWEILGKYPGKSHGQRSLAGYSPKDPERVRLDFQTKQCNAKRVLKTSLRKGELCIHLALFIEYLAYWHELGP